MECLNFLLIVFLSEGFGHSASQVEEPGVFLSVAREKCSLALANDTGANDKKSNKLNKQIMHQKPRKIT